MKLENRSVLITGAASGIGRAAALLFAREGARLTLIDVESAGEETASLARKSGAEAIFMSGDVSRSDDYGYAVESAIKIYGGLDVLYNNAGVGLYKPLLETTEEEWDRVIDVDLKSCYIGAKYAIPQMLEHGGGVIINTGSEIGISGARNYAAYCAAKGGVVNLTQAYRHRIRGEEHPSQLPLPRCHDDSHARSWSQGIA